MFRQLATRPASLPYKLSASPVSRSFSTSVVRMAEGDTGAPRNTGGFQSGDQWTKKEAAQENIYVHRKELEKLKELKEKLQQQRKHLDELETHIDSLTKEQGGN